jgi:hypothetical protein
MPLIHALHRVIHARTTGRPLAVARVLIGVNCVFTAIEAWRMFLKVLPPLIVKVPYAIPLPALPLGALPVFIAIWLVAALLFAAGFLTRIAGVTLALATGYTLLLDQQMYSNHLYLLFVLVALLTIADPGAAWSIDAWRRGAERDVARWPIVLLQLQITIVYVFSAFAKITPRYLDGEILMRSLKDGAVPSSMRTPALLSGLAIASIVVELFIAIGLWSRRTRLLAILGGAGFHALVLASVESSRLSLAIFAINMFAGYVLFASTPPDTTSADRSPVLEEQGLI